MTPQIEYRHTAYPSAWLAGASGLLYSVSFVIIARNNPSLGTGLSGLFLLIGGLLGASALLGSMSDSSPRMGHMPFGRWSSVWPARWPRRFMVVTTSPSAFTRPTR